MKSMSETMSPYNFYTYSPLQQCFVSADNIYRIGLLLHFRTVILLAVQRHNFLEFFPHSFLFNKNYEICLRV